LWDTCGQTNPKGLLSARIDNNRQIEFNPSEHPHFDHGYAVTSHGSQGLPPNAFSVTLKLGSTRTCSTPASATFPSPSRASHEVRLFTDDMAKLEPQLAAEVSKTRRPPLWKSISLHPQHSELE
jgi:hypothetical protein